MGQICPRNRLLEQFEPARRGILIAIPLLLGWVLSRSLPSISIIFPICFKAVTQIASDFNLAVQSRNWYNMESFGAYDQIDPRSAFDSGCQEV